VLGEPRRAAKTGRDERRKTGRGGGSGRAATAAVDGPRRRRWTGCDGDGGRRRATTTALDGRLRRRWMGTVARRGGTEEPAAEQRSRRRKKKLDQGGLD